MLYFGLLSAGDRVQQCDRERVKDVERCPDLSVCVRVCVSVWDTEVCVFGCDAEECVFMCVCVCVKR